MHNNSRKIPVCVARERNTTQIVSPNQEKWQVDGILQWKDVKHRQSLVK